MRKRSYVVTNLTGFVLAVIAIVGVLASFVWITGPKSVPFSAMFDLRFERLGLSILSFGFFAVALTVRGFRIPKRIREWREVLENEVNGKSIGIVVAQIDEISPKLPEGAIRAAMDRLAVALHLYANATIETELKCRFAVASAITTLENLTKDYCQTVALVAASFAASAGVTVAVQATADLVQDSRTTFTDENQQASSGKPVMGTSTGHAATKESVAGGAIGG